LPKGSRARRQSTLLKATASSASRSQSRKQSLHRTRSQHDKEDYLHSLHNNGTIATAKHAVRSRRRSSSVPETQTQPRSRSVSPAIRRRNSDANDANNDDMPCVDVDAAQLSTAPVADASSSPVAIAVDEEEEESPRRWSLRAVAQQTATAFTAAIGVFGDALSRSQRNSDDDDDDDDGDGGGEETGRAYTGHITGAASGGGVTAAAAAILSSRAALAAAAAADADMAAAAAADAVNDTDASTGQKSSTGRRPSMKRRDSTDWTHVIKDEDWEASRFNFKRNVEKTSSLYDDDEFEEFGFDDSVTVRHSGVCCSRFVPSFFRDSIRPGSKFGALWSLMVLIISFYDCIVVPYRVAFKVIDDHSVGVFFVVDFVTDLILVLDIFVQLHTAFKTHGEVVTSLPRIRHRYYRSWMTCDVLAALPVDLIQLQYGVTHWARLNKVLRLPRIAHLLFSLESAPGVNALSGKSSNAKTSNANIK
jgi:hypothetical protein